jgi:hypothetical protein
VKRLDLASKRGENRRVTQSEPSTALPVDLDALLCALVLVPEAFSRNRFFGVFEDPAARRVRRRAARVRGLIRQLSGQRRHRAELIGEQVLDDGQVLVSLRIVDLAFERTTALSEIEASVMRYALHRAGWNPLDPVDRARVESALTRLGRFTTAGAAE